MYVDNSRQIRLFDNAPNERRKHKHANAEDFTRKFLNHNTTDECYIIWKLSPRERAIIEQLNKQTK